MAAPRPPAPRRAPRRHGHHHHAERTATTAAGADPDRRAVARLPAAPPARTELAKEDALLIGNHVPETGRASLPIRRRCAEEGSGGTRGHWREHRRNRARWHPGHRRGPLDDRLELLDRANIALVGLIATGGFAKRVLTASRRRRSLGASTA